jgi:hypothetical protein
MPVAQVRLDTVLQCVTTLCIAHVKIWLACRSEVLAYFCDFTAINHSIRAQTIDLRAWCRSQCDGDTLEWRHKATSGDMHCTCTLRAIVQYMCRSSCARCRALQHLHMTRNAHDSLQTMRDLPKKQ